VHEAGPGGRVWESAPRLARFLTSDYFGDGSFVGKRLLELGAGTGLCGIVAANLGATVVLTDKKFVMANMRENVIGNGLSLDDGSVLLEELEWGRNIKRFLKSFSGPDQAFDYVICSDVAYHESLFKPLAKTLLDVASPTTTVILAHQIRDVDESMFFEYLDEAFVWEKVPCSYWFDRKEESEEEENTESHAMIIVAKRRFF